MCTVIVLERLETNTRHEQLGVAVDGTLRGVNFVNTRILVVSKSVLTVTEMKGHIVGEILRVTRRSQHDRVRSLHGR